MLNFVICDDNLNLLDKLSKILENIFVKNEFDAQIVLKTDNTDTLLDFVNSTKTDVLILDINLKSNKSGLDIAKAVREKNKDIYIIFKFKLSQIQTLTIFFYFLTDIMFCNLFVHKNSFLLL